MGKRQPVMMRVISAHLKPLERQVTESANILASSKVYRESLNLKTEWGGAKIPSLLVNTPKGLVKLIEEASEEAGSCEDIQKRLKEAVRRGQKRLEYVEDESSLEAI